MMMIAAFCIITAYLLGSISSAIIICRLTGKADPRTVGSNNPGATNIKRLYGNAMAAVVLLVDVLKGLIPVLLAQSMGLDIVWQALVALAAIVGHVWPIFFGFKGGKAVATSIGAYFVISWPAALILIGIWIIVAFGFKISSLAALIANIAAPLVFYYFTQNLSVALIILLVSVLVLFRHSSNIKRLLDGTEG